ncbi:MAG TPA: type II toxin-antitoxin system VapC family toxin [Blastocatellia bacterium]|nr:type II toxin-antitoxin system VapC family toxin [Blastocatellia bacterium]
MNVLLDTHAFIYWIENNTAALSPTGFTIIADKSNTIFLSLASIWEMQIKIQIGKLKLVNDLSDVVKEQQQVNGMQLLAISPQYIYNLSQLPLHHNDPFDRMLLSQAITEGFSLLSQDSKFAAYGANVIW